MGGKKKGGKAAPSSAASAYKMTSDVCIRCPVPEAKSAAHDVLVCNADASSSLLWNGFQNGDENAKPQWEEHDDCKNLLVQLQNGSKVSIADQFTNDDKKEALSRFKQAATFNKKPVSKVDLSKAFDVVKAEAKIEKQKAKSKGTPAPSKPSESTQSASTNLPIHTKAGVAAGSSGVSSASFARSKASWKVDPVPAYAANVEHKTHDYAILENYAAHKLPPARGHNEQRVITNYVLVKNTPEKVYEYTIIYSHMEGKDDSKSSPGKAKSSKPKDATDGDSVRKINQLAQKQRIFEELRKMSPLNNHQGWATDYETVWSVTPLYDHAISDKLITARVEFAKLSGKPCATPSVTFVFENELVLHDHGSSLDPSVLVDAKHQNKKGESRYSVALNALISSYVKSNNSNIIMAGTNKFYVRNGYDKFSGLQAHRGYHVSIRPGADRVLLNIGTTTGTFFQPVKVTDFLDLMASHDFHDYPGSGLERGQKLLCGRNVKILYQREMINDHYDPNKEENRHRVIADFGKKPSEQTFMFKDDDGVEKEITVYKYFTEKLGGNPSNKYNCVNVGVKSTPKTQGKQIWIPAEYLTIDREQQFGRRLSSKHMEQLIGFALHHPAKQQFNIHNEALTYLGLAGNGAALSHLQLQVEPRLLSIPARFLREPVLLYGEDRTKQSSGASWDVMKVSFRSGPVIKPRVNHRRSLSTIDIRTTWDGGPGEWLGEGVVKVMNRHGMGVQFPHSPPTENQPGAPPPVWKDYHYIGHTSQFDDGVVQKKIEASLTANLGKNGRPDLNLVILQNKDTDTYAQIKRIFDQHMGAISVCLTSEKLIKGRGHGAIQGEALEQQLQQLFSNLAMKFNLKLRGQNHAVQSAFHSIERDTMVMGADVSHAPSQMAFCPSVAAVVASDSADFANFPGSMRLQTANQEFIQDLREMVKERLYRYARNMGSVPRRIIFYRDGVGENMFEQLKKQGGEIEEIYTAFEEARAELFQLHRKRDPGLRSFTDHNANLQLTFIVVGKRHHTRFYCEEPAQTTKNDKKPIEAPTNVTLKGQPPVSYSAKGKPLYKPTYNGNVKPGLLVDQVITRPRGSNDAPFDFFLQSHEGLKGTARPAHYTVLQRGAFSEADIKNLTYNFCFIYARATKGVSYASPAYYADRLCERGTLYLKAYTHGKDQPDLAMRDDETQTKEGRERYARRVPAHVSRSPLWNPNLASDDISRQDRKNPWHPNMDDVMFWL